MTDEQPPSIGSLVDTTSDADKVQFQILREMQPRQRSMLAAEFSEDIRNVTLAGIRARHPNMSQRQVLIEFARLTLTQEEFARAYGRKESGS